MIMVTMIMVIMVMMLVTVLMVVMNIRVMITMELTMIANIEEFKKDDGGLLVRLVMMIRKILC